MPPEMRRRHMEMMGVTAGEAGMRDRPAGSGESI